MARGKHRVFSVSTLFQRPPKRLFIDEDPVSTRAAWLFTTSSSCRVARERRVNVMDKTSSFFDLMSRLFRCIDESGRFAAESGG